jgi:hypothetical protein
MNQKDRVEIDRLAETLTAAWNAADGVAFAEMFTEDADFIRTPRLTRDINVPQTVDADKAERAAHSGLSAANDADRRDVSMRTRRVYSHVPPEAPAGAAPFGGISIFCVDIPVRIESDAGATAFRRYVQIKGR